MPAFFLSYARADADPYFEKFYGDFLQELRGRLGGTTTDGLGFRDVAEIQLGDVWRRELREALRTSKTFIAMLSPTWIRRPACRVEWSAFAWRLQQHEDPPTALLPLVWIPVDPADLPPAIEEFQASHRDLPAAYSEHGLRYVVQRGGNAYRDLLSELAKKVTNLVKGGGLPEAAQLPEIAGLDLDALAGPPTPPALPARPAGPKYVEFILVAARRQQVDAIRDKVDAYGMEPDDWRPWYPPVDTPIGPMVQLVAASSRLTSTIVTVADDLEARLRAAQENNTIALLVVDVWTLRLGNYETQMRLFDSLRLANAAVLVLWNENDDETIEHQNVLLDGLRSSFPNLFIVRDTKAFHDRVAQPDQFETLLREVLQEVRRRIIEFGMVARRVTGPSIAQPRL